MKKLIYICLLSITGLFTSTTALGDVVVIVHKSNIAEIDQQVISKIFLGKVKSFPGGSSAKAGGLSEGSDATEVFNKIVLNKKTAQLKSYWSQRVFTGKGIPPKQFSSDSEVIDWVANNPEAIGYVSSIGETDSVRVVGKFEK